MNAEVAPRSDLPRLARKVGLVVVVGLVLLAGLMTLAIGVGTVWIAPADVWAALAGTPGEPAHGQIVMGLRLPRTLIAALAGAMLALAGTVLQSATRNDLADPSLIGVTSGGALAIVVTLYATGLDVVPAPWSVLLAFGGGAAASGIIWVLSWRQSTRSTRIVLDGVLVSSVLGSFVSVLLILDGALFAAVLRWVVGSLNARVWQDLTTLWPVALVAIPLAFALGRWLDGLWMGESVAAATGIRPTTARLLTLGVATLLTAGAVSVVGAIGFVGLIGPHVARRIVGERPTRVIPVAMMVGALLLVSADVFANALSLVVPSAEVGGRTPLPAGAVTAIVGGPLLFVLLMRRGR